MTDTFIWKVLATAAGDGEFSVKESGFGDGYKQTVPQGINGESQVWSVTFSGRDRPGQFGVRDPLQFIRDRKGGISFFWKPPLGVQGYYQCRRYSIRDQGGGYFTIDARFEQVFHP